MQHDAIMEAKYNPTEPIDCCREFAAIMLDVSVESVYMVMFSFVLGGYKAFCSSNELHGLHGKYAEVVYNAVKDEWYCILYEETNRVTFVGD